MEDNELNTARQQLHQTQANLDYLLELRGDRIASEHGWTNVNGLEAVRYYLMQKHHWTPAELATMSLEHLRFAMSEEPAGLQKRKA